MRFSLLALVLLSACEEKKSASAPAVERFAAVKKKTETASSKFCEKKFPASGDGALKLNMPPLRAFAGDVPKRSGWLWLNLWATWCKPCVEEMSLLSRWGDAFSREKMNVTFELLSIDEESAQAELETWKKKSLPGHISWAASPDVLDSFLGGLGISNGASIPVHVLVDAQNMIRCVRVGSIHEENWGAVREIVSSN